MSNHHDVDERPVKALLKYQTFMINNYRTKMLISINILIIKDIDLIIFTRTRHINNCYITFEFTIAPLLRLFIK